MNGPEQSGPFVRCVGMYIPKITDLVRPGQLAQFVRFDGDALWYCVTWVEGGSCNADPDKKVGNFEFPIPVTDTTGGVFLRTDKSSIFMRWMRKHIEFLSKAVEEAKADDGD